MFVAFRSTSRQVPWHICLLLKLCSPENHSTGKDVDTHTEFEKVTHNKNAVPIIIINIIIIIISFIQGIYTYIPETNYVRMEYSVTAILLLLFIVFISLISVLNLLYFYVSTFRSVCAVPNMAVSWSYLTSCFPGKFAHVFSKWLWNSPSRPYYYWYHRRFYIPRYYYHHHHHHHLSRSCAVYTAIQGVPGGKDLTSGECSLGQTISI